MGNCTGEQMKCNGFLPIEVHCSVSQKWILLIQNIWLKHRKKYSKFTLHTLYIIYSYLWSDHTVIDYTQPSTSRSLHSSCLILARRSIRALKSNHKLHTLQQLRFCSGCLRSAELFPPPRSTSSTVLIYSKIGKMLLARRYKNDFLLLLLWWFPLGNTEQRKSTLR